MACVSADTSASAISKNLVVKTRSDSIIKGLVEISWWEIKGHPGWVLLEYIQDIHSK